MDTEAATGFWLGKWYMDVVAPDGRAFVGYQAALRWGVVRVRYSGAMWRGASGRVRSESSAGVAAEPEICGGKVGWVCGPLGVEGAWRGAGAESERTLLATDAGAVRWACVVPSGESEVRGRRGEVVRGWGYVERLELTHRPWALPIDELRWGRFCGERGGVVWIEWRGPEPRVALIDRGRDAADAAIGDEAVSWDGGASSLAVLERSVLRDGALGTTVLGAIPVLRGTTPARILATRETKWLSRVRIERRGEPAEEGWAIHEVVKFGARP